MIKNLFFITFVPCPFVLSTNSNINPNITKDLPPIFVSCWWLFGNPPIFSLKQAWELQFKQSFKVLMTQTNKQTKLTTVNDNKNGEEKVLKVTEAEDFYVHFTFEACVSWEITYFLFTWLHVKRLWKRIKIHTLPSWVEQTSWHIHLTQVGISSLNN